MAARRLVAIWRDGVALEGRAWHVALAVVLLGCSLFFAVALSWVWGPVRSGNMVFSDFFALWSYGRFAAAHPGAEIYDAARMHAFQGELFAARRLKAPFAYPPPYVFMVLPLAAAGIWVAAVVWSVVSLAAFAVAAGAGRGWVAALAAVCPAAAVCVAYGQNGLLIAALLVGGVRLLPQHPGWAGGLFALACVKPQLAFLVPLALLAAREWRAIVSGLGSGALLALASVLWLGAAAWPAWLDAVLAQGELVAGAVSPYRQVTVQASLAILGFDRAMALAWQATAACVVAVGVVLAWRHGPSPAAGAALLSGTLLATPYAFQYDLVLLAGAALLLLSGRRRVSWPEAAILSAAMLLPAVLSLTSRFFWLGPVTLATVFGLAVVRAVRPGRV